MESFDAVIVGSGFGGSVSAYRLAEAGRRVCLLERGKAYPPGSFPRSPYALAKNVWDPAKGFQGMFDIWSFDSLQAVISSGLGGGSLIYANVLLRKDEKWFVDETRPGGGYVEWPVTRADLDPHYDRVEPMLNAQRYPMGHAPYGSTPKTLAMKAAADRLGMDWFLPNLAVTFANDGADPVPGELIREEFPNLHGRQRSTCRLCGECDVGCNYGSKNTLDYNYLTHAQRLGAEIRVRSEVRAFRPREGGGYEVDYVTHEPEAEGKPTDVHALPIRTIHARRLILSAGTLGTNYLLLTNRAALPGLSRSLGHRFSCNGDVLTFALRSTEEPGRVPRVIDPSRGPVITSTIRVPDAADGTGATGRGFYLQDAGYPEFLNWVIEAADSPSRIRLFFEFLYHRLVAWWRRSPDMDVSAAIADLLGPCVTSSGSMPILGMGRDEPLGTLGLRRARGSKAEWLNIDWPNAKEGGYYDRVRDASRQVAESLGAEFYQNPFAQFFHRPVTVHPLGGCSMGRDPGEGVVDSYGRVFGCPGLYVADGSVMPGPVGANPSLTIAALADRFADGILAESGG